MGKVKKSEVDQGLSQTLCQTRLGDSGKSEASENRVHVIDEGGVTSQEATRDLDHP